MEAVIFVGIQATGKSSFYKERFFKTHVRINLDMLKTRHREHVLIQACLAAKQPFVVDNTNVTVEARARYIARAHEAGFRVIGYCFRSDLESALRRNQERQGKERIPEQGLVAMSRKLQTPTLDEGFDQLYDVCLDQHGQFVVTPWVDVD